MVCSIHHQIWCTHETICFLWFCTTKRTSKPVLWPWWFYPNSSTDLQHIANRVMASQETLPAWASWKAKEGHHLRPWLGHLGHLGHLGSLMSIAEPCWSGKRLHNHGKTHHAMTGKTMENWWSFNGHFQICSIAMKHYPGSHGSPELTQSPKSHHTVPVILSPLPLPRFFPSFLASMLRQKESSAIARGTPDQNERACAWG